MVKRAPDIDAVPLRLSRGLGVALSAQIAHELRLAISCGRMPVGQRLPSTRRLAGALDVSRNTVQYAYDELMAEGTIEGRVGAGTYVVKGVRIMRFKDPDGHQMLLRRYPAGA